MNKITKIYSKIKFNYDALIPNEIKDNTKLQEIFTKLSDACSEAKRSVQFKDAVGVRERSETILFGTLSLNELIKSLTITALALVSLTQFDLEHHSDYKNDTTISPIIHHVN